MYSPIDSTTTLSVHVMEKTHCLWIDDRSRKPLSKIVNHVPEDVAIIAAQWQLFVYLQMV